MKFVLDHSFKGSQVKKFIQYLALGVLVVFSFSSWATDYTITKRGNTQTITTDSGAKWTGYIASIPGKLKGQTQTMSFDFTTPDYFKKGNEGHFAIGINGNGYTIEGRGIVIGNVTAYPDKNDGCYGSETENAVVFESFWSTGNCVFGWSESEPLVNNAKYHIEITSNQKLNVISYDLYQYIGVKRYLVSSHKTYDYSLSDAPQDSDGWFIAEVFSQHNWTMYITNLSVR